MLGYALPRPLPDVFPGESRYAVTVLAEAVVDTASVLAGNRWLTAPSAQRSITPQVWPLDIRGALLHHLTEPPRGRLARVFLRDAHEWQRVTRVHLHHQGTLSDEELGDTLLRSEAYRRVLIGRVAVLEVKSLAGHQSGTGFDRVAT